MRAAHGGERTHALHKHMCTQDDWWINNGLTCKPFSSMHICAHKVRSTDINCCKNQEFICLHGAKINCIFHPVLMFQKNQTYPVKTSNRLHLNDQCRMLQCSVVMPLKCVWSICASIDSVCTRKHSRSSGGRRRLVDIQSVEFTPNCVWSQVAADQ